MKKRFLLTLGSALVVAAPVAVAVSCNDNKSSTHSSFDMDFSDNTYDVAMEESHAPLYYHISDEQYTKLIENNTDVALKQKLVDLSAKVSTGGYNIGYDIYVQNEIAKQISSAVGHPVSTLIHPTEWTNIIKFSEDKSNHIDSIIASMTILEARKRFVKFSDPYYNSKNGLIFRTNYVQKTSGVNYPFYSKASDVLESTMFTSPKIGTLSGTIHEVIAHAIRPFVGVETSATLQSLIQDLRANKVNAILIDETSKDYALSKLGSDYGYDGGADPRFQTKTQETFGVAMPLGVSSSNEALVNKGVKNINQDKMTEQMEIVSKFAADNKLS